MKSLKINCAICDARSVSEKTLESYEGIKINCASILTTPASRELLGRYNVSMNCASVLSVEEGVRLVTVNGKSEIRPTDPMGEKKFLVVNGQISIVPGSEEVLTQYAGILINGKVICPESLQGALGMMTVNGKAVVYPDEAIVLDDTAAIDKLFALRAKNKLYWSDGRMIMTDPRLDAAGLEAKGATFSAPEFIIAESLVESVLPMIDEKADIKVVPDGTRVIGDDVELTASTLRRYGTRLYVLDDLEADDTAAAVLEKIEYLHICGDVRLTEGVEDLFHEKAEVEGAVESLKVIQGRCMSGLPMVKITRWMLDQEEDGIVVSDCAMVKLDADVDNDTILKKLTFTDCAMVRCTPDQEDAVAMVSSDVAKIGGVEEAAENGDLTRINCAEYVL